MESVSETTLRAFAGFFPHPRLSGVFGKLYWEGFLGEQLGFYELGARLGYFDSDFDAYVKQNPLLGLAALELQGVDKGRVLKESSKRPRAEITALFQAALHLADGFSHHLIVAMQRALQDEESVLDSGVMSCSGGDLWVALGDAVPSNELSVSYDSEPPLVTDTAQIMGGFIELIALLGAFDNLFDGISVEDKEAASTVIDRSFVVRTIANLLVWRLNLRDERTVKRLNVVIQAFWELCSEEFMEQPHGFTWNVKESLGLLKSLLENWKNRSDPNYQAKQLPKAEPVGEGGIPIARRPIRLRKKKDSERRRVELDAEIE